MMQFNNNQIYTYIHYTHMSRLISLAPISSLYLFSISVRSKSFIGKFGYTKDLHRRAREHKKVYGPGITLEAHTPIEPHYLRLAERKLVRFFKENDMCIRPQGIPGQELVWIHHLDLAEVLIEYSRIGQELECNSVGSYGSYTMLYDYEGEGKSKQPLIVR